MLGAPYFRYLLAGGLLLNYYSQIFSHSHESTAIQFEFSTILHRYRLGWNGI